MDEKNSTEERGHRAVEDPSGRAIRCSCGAWSMLYRNSFGLDAAEEHRRHVAAERDKASHPESTCGRCGGPNIPWSAPSPLWNEVIRGGSINGIETPSSVVCPTCFAVLAEEKGIASLWRLSAERVNVPLETVTPSGRVWNPETWRFDDPAERPQ